MRVSLVLRLVLVGAIASAALTLLLDGFWPGVLGGTFDPGVYSLLLALFTLPALACASAMERGKQPTLMVAGIGCSYATCLGWILLHRETLPVSIETLLRALLILTTCAFACMSIGLLLLPRLRQPAAVWLRRGTIVLIAMLTVQVAGAVLFYPDSFGSDWEEREAYVERMSRIGGALAIGVGFGVITTLLLGNVRHFSAEPQELEDERRPFQIVCPRCTAEHEIRTGGDHCPTCGLRVRVVTL